MNASELRKEAREVLKDKWIKAVCITSIYMVLSYAISYIQYLLGAESIISDILDLVYFIINIPLSFGLVITFMKLKGNEEVKVYDFIKDGFSRFKKSFGITWHTFVKLLSHIILGLFICIIILLILLFIGYTTITDRLAFLGLIYLSVISVSYLLIIWIFPKYLLYILSYNISYDNPELTSKECVLRSAELMKGNRRKYFLLELSFIGWLILAGLTYGIGMLLLTPYMQVATICFYEKVAKIEIKNTEPAEKIEE